MTGDAQEAAVCVRGRVVGLVRLSPGPPPPVLLWAGRYWVWAGCCYECLATWVEF
jgi:hypothetical protein